VQGKAVEFDCAFVTLTFDFVTQIAFGIEFNAIENTDGEHHELLDILTRFLPLNAARALNPISALVRTQLTVMRITLLIS